jgi:hypothetical protein
MKGSRRFVAPLGALILAMALSGPAALSSSQTQELPLPTPRNSVVISLEHNPQNAAEAEYIKKAIPFGLYAWPSFSITTMTPDIPWQAPLDAADANLAKFKSAVKANVAAAKARGFKFHLVLSTGLARNRTIYKDAKLEDVRNCQWYNDNTIAPAAVLSRPGGLEDKAFGTLSRYARKVRTHLEAKARAAFAFLTELIAAEPDTLVAVSGWGEAELNFGRIENDKAIQSFFCDYSPFAVLEFRDWIQHAGEYDDARGPYRNEGWTQGGRDYQGPEGLARFNAEFGTDFSAWNLRYFDWSLEDDYDPDFSDKVNNDPKRIPYASYAGERMRPGAGPHFVAGGFDPPRTMKPGDKFWDLWNLFRETMVGNFVRDGARWAAESGVPADRLFSHQIPGDYLFGTKPGDAVQNARYYTSASPLRTADIAPYGHPGATIYDVRFPTWFARTTEHIYPAISAMSPIWAIMEFDPELYPIGMEVKESPVPDILKQYLRVYEYNVYLINFWRWWDETKEHRIKGMNKEIALAQFVAAIRDKAKAKDLTTVFSPPPVGMLSATSTPGEIAIPEKIWAQASWTWTMWGDFDRFEIYRSDKPGVPIDPAHLVGKTRDPVFRDKAAKTGTSYYYRVRAVNVKNAAGRPSPELQLRPGKGM